MEHEKLTWNFVISHGLLPILPAYFTIFFIFFGLHFSQNDANAKSGREMVMENEKMVMEK